jgi:small-conductance mechanosensitive channel
VLQSAWAGVRDTIAAVPDSVKTALLTAVSIALALVIARIADTALRRALAVRHPFLYSLLLRMEGPLRLALVLLALNVAVAAAPLDPTLALWLGYLLQVAFIAMVGWMLLGALNVATDIYLRRFDVEADDNLLARKQVTQVRILKGAISTTIVVITVATALMTFEAVRKYGVSLFACAGIAGIVVGLAARPMLSNLAGVQLAITQPIRLEDAVLVENEMGFVEEITSTYVVVRLWDWRRMVVPLTYFIERPFQNWTRENSALIGTVLIRTDYTVPVDRMRAKVDEILKETKLWMAGYPRCK